MTENIAAEIDRRLVATKVPGSPNQFTAAEIRDLAIEYLEDNEKDMQDHPEIAGQPHWSLWMADAQFENALFAAFVFRTDGAEFLCGTGDAFAIKQFAENEIHDDINQIPAELCKRFSVPAGSLRLTRGTAVEWLGRGW